MEDPAPPPVLLILGVDASGKDHVANVAVTALADAGMAVDKRPGWLCARAVSRHSSEDKGRLRLARERLFVATFPLLRPLVVPLCSALLSVDVRRFRRSRAAGGPATVVVSHTPIRVAAFALGHRADGDAPRISRRAERALRDLASVAGLRVVVLDISAEVRAARLSDRAMRGRLDHLDRYLANPANAALAERIEATLVALAVEHLGATVVHNDRLDDAAIAAALGLAAGAADPADPAADPTDPAAGSTGGHAASGTGGDAPQSRRARRTVSDAHRSVAGWRGDRSHAAAVV